MADYTYYSPWVGALPFELEDLILIFCRLVQTDMGNQGARAFGLEKADLTIEESSRNTAHIVSFHSLLWEEKAMKGINVNVNPRLIIRLRKSIQESSLIRLLTASTLGRACCKILGYLKAERQCLKELDSFQRIRRYFFVKRK